MRCAWTWLGRAGDAPTELRRLATSFQLMATALETTVEQQRDLAASTSHQLRNPLAGVRLHVDVLAGDGTADPGVVATGAAATATLAPDVVLAVSALDLVEMVDTAIENAVRCAGPTLEDETVAHVVDRLFEAGPQLVPQPSGGLQYLAPATLFDTFPVPLHPAAAQRYRERHG